MSQATLSASQNISLGVNNHGAVGRIIAQVVGTGWTGSAVPKIRLAGQADADLKTYPYINLATGAVVAAGTAITGDGLFAFPVEGYEVVLVYTHTSGSAVVTFFGIDGTGLQALTLSAGDIEIGQVELKDSATSAQPRMLAPSALATTDVAVNAHDTSVGLTTDAGVVTDANGTVTGFLRGIVKLLIATLTVNQVKGTKSLAATVAVSSIAGGTVILAANAARKSAFFYNAGSVTVYIGVSAALLATTAVPLVAGASFEDSNSNDVWYGLAASGTGDIRVIEVA